MLTVLSRLTCLSSSKEIIVKKFSNKDSSSDLLKKNRIIPLCSNALSEILFPRLKYLSPDFFVENKKNEFSVNIS